jgi:hypothetical protein
MSKIALSGNSLGTGTLTIAAPNTSSDRTLSLPDAAGEMYTQGNILGTVSQSGGVPTGAIIERGSNANGEFVKYADGTMICQHVFTGVNISTTSSVTNLRYGEVLWTHPAAFISLPVVYGHRQGGGGMGTGVFVTNSDNSFRFWDNHTTSRSGQNCYGTAIGRWY